MRMHQYLHTINLDTGEYDVSNISIVYKNGRIFANNIMIREEYMEKIFTGSLGRPEFPNDNTTKFHYLSPEKTKTLFQNELLKYFRNIISKSEGFFAIKTRKQCNNKINKIQNILETAGEELEIC